MLRQTINFLLIPPFKNPKHTFQLRQFGLNFRALRHLARIINFSILTSPLLFPRWGFLSRLFFYLLETSPYSLKPWRLLALRPSPISILLFFRPPLCLHRISGSRSWGQAQKRQQKNNKNKNKSKHIYIYVYVHETRIDLLCVVVHVNRRY